MVWWDCFFSTTNEEWIYGFGDHVYSIKIHDEFNYKIMSISDFHKLTCTDVSEDAEQYFTDLRLEFLTNKIDYILIEESDGTCGMGLFINLDIELNKIN